MKTISVNDFSFRKMEVIKHNTLGKVRYSIVLKVNTNNFIIDSRKNIIVKI
jgi:hypothetical protein